MRKDNIINSLSKINNHSFYLSFFRVVISLLIIKEVFQIFPIISSLYRDNLLLSPPATVIQFINFDTKFLQDNIYVYIYTYMFILILYLFGIGKNFTALIVFIMTDILQKLCPYILNGGDNILKFLLLYMVFADSFTHFSIHKTKTKINSYYNVLSNLSALAICIHLCSIYFISALHKANTTVWFHGVATYYTFQLERFSGTSLNEVLAKNELFVLFSTYFTLLLEMYYPFLVWFKKTKPIVILCMICLHAGIGVFMMLYDFQLIFILAQGFFFKDSFWLPKYEVLKNKIEHYKFYRLKKNDL